MSAGVGRRCPLFPSPPAAWIDGDHLVDARRAAVTIAANNNDDDDHNDDRSLLRYCIPSPPRSRLLLPTPSPPVFATTHTARRYFSEMTKAPLGPPPLLLADPAGPDDRRAKTSGVLLPPTPRNDRGSDDDGGRHPRTPAPSPLSHASNSHRLGAPPLPTSTPTRRRRQSHASPSRD